MKHFELFKSGMGLEVRVLDEVEDVEYLLLAIIQIEEGVELLHLVNVVGERL